MDIIRKSKSNTDEDSVTSISGSGSSNNIGFLCHNSGNVIQESVFETVISFFQSNTKFTLMYNGITHYVGAYLDLSSFGGFTAKDKKDDSKGKIINLINSGKICCLYTPKLAERNGIVIIPNYDTLDAMSDFNLFADSTVKYKLCLLDVDNEDVIILNTDVTYNNLCNVSNGNADIQDLLRDELFKLYPDNNVVQNVNIDNMNENVNHNNVDNVVDNVNKQDKNNIEDTQYMNDNDDFENYNSTFGDNSVVNSQYDNQDYSSNDDKQNVIETNDKNVYEYEDKEDEENDLFNENNIDTTNQNLSLSDINSSDIIIDEDSYKKAIINMSHGDISYSVDINHLRDTVSSVFKKKQFTLNYNDTELDNEVNIVITAYNDKLSKMYDTELENFISKYVSALKKKCNLLNDDFNLMLNNNSDYLDAEKEYDERKTNFDKILGEKIEIIKKRYNSIKQSLIDTAIKNAENQYAIKYQKAYNDEISSAETLLRIQIEKEFSSKTNDIKNDIKKEIYNLLDSYDKELLSNNLLLIVKSYSDYYDKEYENFKLEIEKCLEINADRCNEYTRTHNKFNEYEQNLINTKNKYEEQISNLLTSHAEQINNVTNEFSNTKNNLERNLSEVQNKLNSTITSYENKINIIQENFDSERFVYENRIDLLEDELKNLSKVKEDEYNNKLLSITDENNNLSSQVNNLEIKSNRNKKMFVIITIVCCIVVMLLSITVTSFVSKSINSNNTVVTDDAPTVEDDVNTNIENNNTSDDVIDSNTTLPPNDPVRGPDAFSPIS